MNFANQSLGFVLADAGYDVWLGNLRGNTYATNHKYLNSSQEEFWNFSWSDMAEKDLTAMIDFVLEKTGEKNLIYVGHSQGTMIAFSQLGSNKDLASKIRLFIALGPVSTVGHIKSPIKYIANIRERVRNSLFGSLFLEGSLLSPQIT